MPNVAELFSPAKMVLLFYGFLVWKCGHPLTTNLKWWLFAFLLVEIGHNDFLRVVLNEMGERLKARLRKPAEDHSSTPISPPPAAGQ